MRCGILGAESCGDDVCNGVAKATYVLSSVTANADYGIVSAIPRS
jgi:hypothetical protein